MTYAYAPEATQKKSAPAADAEPQGAFAGLKELASKGYDAAMSALAPKEDKQGGGKSEPPKLGPAPSGPLQLNVAEARLRARDWIGRGCTDVNPLTDEVFYAVFPWLRDVKLKGGGPEAKAWVDVRDKAAKPELKAANDAPKKQEEEAKKKEDAPAGGGTTPAADIPAEFHGNGKKAGTNDEYRTQNDNSYEDGEGTWKKSAGTATCNMTAVAMALISIAGSEQLAKEAVAAYIKKTGTRNEATAKVGSKREKLTNIVKDPGKLAKVQLEDLCIAVGVALGNSLDAVTMTGTMLNVAKKSGLVKDGKAYASTEKMKDPVVLARAKTLLAEGKRVIVGTVGHYVYLTAVLDDGILVHDPAGARVQVSGTPKYLWPGSAAGKLGHWDGGLKGDLLPTTLRRVSHNAKVRAAFEQEAAALTLKGQAKTDARNAVKQAHGGTLNTGENNFYSLDELDTYNARIRVILEPNEESQDAGKQGEAP